MSTLALLGIRFLGTVIVAHWLAYFLVGALPDLGLAMLGISAVQEGALTEFTAKMDLPAGYFDSASRMLHLKLGQNLDGVPVNDVLWASITDSAIPFAISLSAVLIVISVFAAFPQLLLNPVVEAGSEFLTFVPAYVPSFIVLAVTGALNWIVYSDGTGVESLIIGVSASIMPCAFVVSTMSNAIVGEMRLPYVRTLHALGLSKSTILKNVKKAALIRLFHVIDKLMLIQMTVLIFSEIVFSVSGVGTMLLLAGQRTDVNTLIPSIVFIAILISLTRMLGMLLVAVTDPRQPNDGSVL